MMSLVPNEYKLDSIAQKFKISVGMWNISMGFSHLDSPAISVKHI